MEHTTHMRATRRLVTAILVIAAAAGLRAQNQSLFTTPALPIVTTIPLGGYPYGLLHADFTGDGIPDALTGSASASQLTVVPVTADGLVGQGIVTTFAPNVGPTGPAPQGPVPIVAWDVNVDGNMDVVCWMTSGIRVVFGLGNGAFNTTLNPPTPPPPFVGWERHLAGDDLDGDGTLEIVAAGSNNPNNPYTGMVSIYDVSPAGFLVHSYTYSPGAFGIYQVFLGDVSNDGLKDIIILRSTQNGGDMDVLVSTTGGLFTAAGPFSTFPLGILLMHVGDLNHDGLNDLIGANAGPTNLEIVAALGGLVGSTLTPNYFRTTTLPPYALQSWYCRDNIGDFDLDGNLDIQTRSRIIRINAAFGGADGMIFEPHPFGSSIFWPPGTPGIYLGAPQGSWDADGDGDLDVFVLGTSGGVPPTWDTYVHAGIGLNQTIYRPGLSASPMTLTVGTPAPGNPAFQLGVSGLGPGAPVALGLSHAAGFHPLGAGSIWLDLGPSSLILPYGNLGLLQADGTGLAQATLSIPNTPSLLGTDYYLQWLAVDPAGPITVGGVNYSLSAARRIFLW